MNKDEIISFLAEELKKSKQEILDIQLRLMDKKLKELSSLKKQ